MSAMVSTNLVELITRAVTTGIAPMYAQLRALHMEIVAMKNAERTHAMDSIWKVAVLAVSLRARLSLTGSLRVRCSLVGSA